MTTIDPARRGSWLALLGFCLGFCLLFVWTYPPISGIEDEVGFVNQAIAWSRGAISFEGAGFSDMSDPGESDVRARSMDFVRVGGRHMPGRHPGRSLILLPFILVGGVHAGFASGLLIHLATTLVGAALLVRLGRSPLWAVLILFHPTLAIYSRTIMGDEAAGGFILLAAVLATRPGTQGAIAAGLAAGIAALMRYHAGLALPIIAASIALDASRDHRRRDGLACLVAGGIIGASIVAYNLILYGAALDPVGGPRGQFGLKFVTDNLPFYAMALMALWPAMLLAPALDRSPIRGMARGVAGVFFVFFLLYYFHDRGSSLIETLVLGLRLIQPALPIWIVSYALVIDALVAMPLRARVGPRPATFIGLAIAFVLLGAVGAVFRQHQNHLLTLAAARDALAVEAPAGSFVVAHNATSKLFGIFDGGPAYRWRWLVVDGVPQIKAAEVDRLAEPWFLAILARGNQPLPDAAIDLIERYKMTAVASRAPGLILYRANPSPKPPASNPGLP